MNRKMNQDQGFHRRVKKMSGGWCPRLLVIVLVCSLWPAGAEDESLPDWYDRISPDKPRAHPLDHGIEARFNLSWKGIIKAGELAVKIGRPKGAGGGALVETVAEGRSTGMARLFWEYGCEFRSLTDTGRMRPVRLKFVEDEAKEVVTTETVYGRDRATYKRKTEQKKPKKGEDPVHVSERTFKLPEMHDLASAVHYLRGLKLVAGEEITLVIYPYHTPYLVTFRVLAREKHKTEFGKVPAIKVDAKMMKVNKKRELEAHKKFKKGTVWISDDEYRIPLEIRTAIYVGDIRATLTDRKIVGGEGGEVTR